MASSRGIVTAFSTVSASAPIYAALTVTSGGASVGYIDMGSVGRHTAPARMMSSAQTVAKTGRRMKKSTNKLKPLSRSCPGCGYAEDGHAQSGSGFLAANWHHRHIIHQELSSRNDYAIARCQSRRNGIGVAHR